jgi:uncharacterized protein YndB with AHSA1/START domain
VTKATIGPALGLRVSRTFAASRERVFRAWTEPEELKKWFGAEEGFIIPIAEVDLRVGGRYRLGMQPPGSDQVLVVGGVYREVQAPAKLVFTWRWEGAGASQPDTFVSIEFHERANATEVILTHEQFPGTAERDSHAHGWDGCFERLGRLLSANPE